jgi:hypothetical protein
MTNKKTVSGSAMRWAVIFIIMIPITLVACQEACRARDSATIDDGKIACMDLKDAHFPYPPAYPENSIGGVQIGINDATHNLRIYASFSKDVRRIKSLDDGYFESDDGGERWRAVATPDKVMNETEELWPLHPVDRRYRYRTIAEQTARPYYDHTGMRREKRWFMERSEDAGRTWRRVKAQIVRSSESIDGFMLLSYHPSNPRVFFISAPIVGSRVLAGLYVTKDGGDTFELKLAGWSLVHLAISNSNPTIMYATNEFDSVVKSEDSGELWTLSGQDREIRELVLSEKTNGKMKETTNPQGNEIYQIEIDPAVPERVYVLSKKGILKSEDGGNKWCVLNLGPGVTTAVNSIAIDPRNHNLLFAGTWAGLYRSNDWGARWEKIQIPERVVK